MQIEGKNSIKAHWFFVLYILTYTLLFIHIPANFKKLNFEL